MKDVTLHVLLSQAFGSDINIKAQTGEQSASCRVEGHVWNTDSVFEFKRCSVTIRRHATGHLPEFADEHGLKGVCGGIEIAPRLEPETFEAGGERIAFPPIQIHIVLDDKSYDRTEKLLRACFTADGKASLSLQFSHRDFARPLMRLEDLDLSAKSIYPIVGFGLSSTRQNNRTVRVPKYKFNAETAATLTFTAADAAIKASVRNSIFSVSAIELTGNMKSKKLGLSSDNDTVEIKEYEENSGWEKGYPEEAFPGVVSVSMKEDVACCWITLYATKENLRQLATLFASMSKGDTIKLEVSMIANGLPLAVGETKDFNVTNYTPVLKKCYS